MVNEKSSAVGVNIQEKATMIWNVADVLRGPFKPHEYGLVILPMTVVKRFSESFGEEAGAHFTSRDIIYLMTDLLLCDAKLDDGNVTVYDMTMGTSQMLSCMEEYIHELNSDVEVTCFGQEFNPSTFAIAKADMMIRGGDPNNMRFGDTLSDDQFPGFTFRYCISNPPFGIDWKREQKAVEAEAAKGELGRFAPGLPKISDGQQLFVLNGLSKLAPGGKMAIIQNGSPLFAGDAGSGPCRPTANTGTTPCMGTSLACIA